MKVGGTCACVLVDGYGSYLSEGQFHIQSCVLGCLGISVGLLWL